MLAEKFFLVLETLRSHASDGKPQIVVSAAGQIPITQPAAQEASRTVSDVAISRSREET